MKSRVWYILVVVVMGTLLGAVAACNYWADPLWQFAKPDSYRPQYTFGFNERQQKVNRLLFNPPLGCNCIILGSSRATYIPADAVKGYTCANLAANNMGPDEYLGWVQQASIVLGRKPELVLIGLDFWGSNANEHYSFQPPADIVAEAQAPFYRWRSLLSFDLLKQSYGVWDYNRRVAPTDKPLYDRAGHKNEFGYTAKVRQKRVADQLKGYRELSYGQYAYRDSLPWVFKQLRDSFPHTRFVVFTTPVSQPMLDMLTEFDLWDEQQRWLTDALSVFDTVHHFMYPNTFCADSSNFYDAQHFTNTASRKLIEPIFGQGDYIGKLLVK